jgi:hypothetical protein
VLKPIALASLDPASPGAWVGPAFVPASHPFAALQDVDNAIAITSRAGQTVTLTGPGAGPEVTAATLIDDVVEAAIAGEARHVPHEATCAVPPVALRQPPVSAWWLRISDPATGDTTTTVTAAMTWDDLQSVAAAHRNGGRRVFAAPVLTSR